MRPNVEDSGPYQIDLILDLWTWVARAADALWALGAISLPSAELRKILAAVAEQGNASISHDDITRTLRVLAAIDCMHAGDWLRMKAADQRMPRRKTPPAVDLQIRLKGLQCKRLVCSLVRLKTGEHAMIPGVEYEAHRVTIHTVRGDVVSAEGPGFANALEGAIKMAGARQDEP